MYCKESKDWNRYPWMWFQIIRHTLGHTSNPCSNPSCKYIGKYSKCTWSQISNRFIVCQFRSLFITVILTGRPAWRPQLQVMLSPNFYSRIVRSEKQLLEQLCFWRFFFSWRWRGHNEAALIPTATADGGYKRVQTDSDIRSIYPWMYNFCDGHIIGVNEDRHWVWFRSGNSKPQIETF